MSNVQLYKQIADTVSPPLRSIVPEPEMADGDTAMEALTEEFFSETAPASEEFVMPMLPQTLRVTGGRPVKFTGRHVAMATGWNTGVSQWYEINLYETEGDEIICEIRLFNKDEGSTDLYRVTKHQSWESAVSWFESYNPSNDLVCHVSVDDERLSAAEVSLRGIRIRQQMLELQTQYQTILGNLLYELKLDLGE
ncbi:MAG: hypothetical protein AAGF15_11720 [Pseudomonadota bacterium]